MENMELTAAASTGQEAELQEPGATPAGSLANSRKVVVMTDKEVRQLMKAAAKEGVAAYKTEQARLREERTEKVRASTKTLLEHYRRLKNMRESSVYDVDTVTNPTLSEVFGWILDECRGDTFTLTSTKKSVLITGMIMNHVDVQLENYRRECEASSIQDVQRRYRVVRMMYLLDEPMRIEDIAEAECIDKSNVYRTLEKAYDDLTALFFGIEGLDIAAYRRQKREEKKRKMKNRAKKSQ